MDKIKYGDHVVTGGLKMGESEQYHSMTLRELYVKEAIGASGKYIAGGSRHTSMIASNLVDFVDQVLQEMSKQED